MALPTSTNLNDAQQTNTFGLLLIDDRAFARRVRSTLDGFDLRIEECSSEIDSVLVADFSGTAAFVVLDRLMTRNQRYAAARSLRVRFRAPVLVVDEDWPARFAEVAGAVQFLDRSHAIVEITRIARFT